MKTLKSNDIYIEREKEREEKNEMRKDKCCIKTTAPIRNLEITRSVLVAERKHKIAIRYVMSLQVWSLARHFNNNNNNSTINKNKKTITSINLLPSNHYLDNQLTKTSIHKNTLTHS